MTIDEFLRREVSLPGYPGACCRMADKWVVEALGFSPLREFGRDFETDADVRRWLAEPGGIAVAFNRVMRANGFRKTKEPQVGDVGLGFRGEQLCAVIKGPLGWVGRDDDGLFTIPACALWKAWKVL